MSYSRKFEYEILPTEAYSVIRHCPICGIKSTYRSSNNFRVNANGNLLDVWLIYQCKKCKHTYNLTIHERLRKEALPSHYYKRLMENDHELGMEYGMDLAVFSRNKVEIDKSSIQYQIVRLDLQDPTALDGQIRYRPGDLIKIRNPYKLQIRTDKIISEILHISRKQEKLLENSGAIILLKEYSLKDIELLIKGDINHGSAVCH